MKLSKPLFKLALAFTLVTAAGVWAGAVVPLVGQNDLGIAVITKGFVHLDHLGEFWIGHLPDGGWDAH